MAGHDPLVTLRLIYQMVSTLLGWIVLRTRSDTTKEIEILDPTSPTRRAPTANAASAGDLDQSRPDRCSVVVSSWEQDVVGGAAEAAHPSPRGPGERQQWVNRGHASPFGR